VWRPSAWRDWPKLNLVGARKAGEMRGGDEGADVTPKESARRKEPMRALWGTSIGKLLCFGVKTVRKSVEKKVDGVVEDR